MKVKVFMLVRPDGRDQSGSHNPRGSGPLVLQLRASQVKPVQSCSFFFFLFKSILEGLVLFYVCEYFACVYVCTTCVPGTHKDQKMLGPLEMELWVVASHSVAAGIGPRSSSRTTSVLFCFSFFPRQGISV